VLVVTRELDNVFTTSLMSAPEIVINVKGSATLPLNLKLKNRVDTF
jgi:hypothetical protein